MPAAWARRLLPGLLPALIAAGYVATLQIFYPGVMTFDSLYMYKDVASGHRGDWQSPVMTELWKLIDGLAPGSASMFLLIATTYWLAFGLLAYLLAKRSIAIAIALLLLALSPPAFFFVGIVWRDVLFAGVWLLSAVLAFAVAERRDGLGTALRIAALGLLLFGVLLRPNALVAAPLLGAYIIWPTHFDWKRTALLFVPAMLALFVLVQLVYYSALGATRQNIVHSILVFDLAGISHFAKQNQFPVAWSGPQNDLLIDGCYLPSEWDVYWRHEPCSFVMTRLEKDKIFGTPTLSGAWKRAILTHPGAYLKHRIAFMWHFLFAPNFTMWTQDLDDYTKPAIQNRASFDALVRLNEVLVRTFMFRAGFWLLACFGVAVIAWRRRETTCGAFAIGICGSAVVYMATFFLIGVCSDFRYAYWAVLASMAGAATLAAGSTWLEKWARSRSLIAGSMLLLCAAPASDPAAAQAAAQLAEQAASSGAHFRDCAKCPEMVVVPAGSFRMGSEITSEEMPVHEVVIAAPFAVSRFEVTFEEWDACVAEKGCSYRPGDEGWGRGRQPVINISWDDAKEYLAWLAAKTGEPYRFLSEAEWEYAARGNSAAKYSFGDDAAALGEHAWINRNSGARAHPVGLKKPNAFGLYDMHGNTWEWVEDTYHDSYAGAPADGAAWIAGADPKSRVLRGGSWSFGPEANRVTFRYWVSTIGRREFFGLRVARALTVAPTTSGKRGR